VPRASSTRDRRDERRRARPERSRTSLVVACGRRPSPSVHTRRRCLRGRSASRDRRRRDRRVPDPCAGVRHGELRRLAADVRPGRHDPDRRRVRRHARPSRLDRRREGRRRDRGIARRDHRLERGARAFPAERPPRHPRRIGVGGIRRPARPAPVAPGARALGAAGPDACARLGICPGTAPGTGPGTGARPDSRGRVSAGASGVRTLTAAGDDGGRAAGGVSRRGRAGPGACPVGPTDPVPLAIIHARRAWRRRLTGGRRRTRICGTGACRPSEYGRHERARRPGSPGPGGDARVDGISGRGRHGSSAPTAAASGGGRRRPITGGRRAPDPRRRSGPVRREREDRSRAGEAPRCDDSRRSSGKHCPRAEEGGTARRRLPGPARSRRPATDDAGRRRDLGSRPGCRTSKRSSERALRQPHGRGGRSGPVRSGRRRRPACPPRGGSRQVGGP
jgi:hypothetical protein